MAASIIGACQINSVRIAMKVKLKMTDCLPAAGKVTRDPFNWPSQGRKDTMSLSTLDPNRDIV